MQGLERMKLDIRWLLRRDFEDVLRIERESFPEEFCWDAKHLLDHLQKRNCIAMVADCPCEFAGLQIAGYMVYELEKTHLLLTNFAVAEWCRRRGVGLQMVEQLKKKLKSHNRRNRIELHIRETNVAAQLFFRAAGFRAVETINEFYANPADDVPVCDESAFRFVYHIASETPRPVVPTSGRQFDFGSLD